MVVIVDFLTHNDNHTKRISSMKIKLIPTRCKISKKKAFMHPSASYSRKNKFSNDAWTTYRWKLVIQSVRSIPWWKHRAYNRRRTNQTRQNIYTIVRDIPNSQLPFGRDVNAYLVLFYRCSFFDRLCVGGPFKANISM